MTNYPRNTEGLKEHIRKKVSEKETVVDEAIRQRIKEERPINFNSVATETKVTKAYLYNHPIHRERIVQFRSQQGEKPKTNAVRPNVSDKGKYVIIAAINKRIKELESENKALKRELEILRGKLYDSYLKFKGRT